MQSIKAFPPKIPVFLTSFLFLSLVVGWQVLPVAAMTVTFGENTGDDFPGKVEDALIHEFYPDLNYGTRGTNPVGEGDTVGRERRSLIRFKDIASSIGAGQVIRSARLYLYCTSEDLTTDYSISAYRVLLNWVEGTQNGVNESGSSCWNYAQYTSLPWNTAGCSAVSDVTGEDSTADRRATATAITTITGTDTYFSWDLTTAVQKWYSGEWSEYGVILIHDTPDTANTRKVFASSDNATDGQRPYLEVTYCPVGGGSTLTVCESGCDYDTITAAINNASSCDTVKVMDSRTYSETVTMKHAVDLESDTGRTPTINTVPNYDHGAVEFTGPMTCNLTGFTIQVPGMASAIFLDGSSGKVNTSIDSCTAKVFSMGIGIRLDGAVSVTITDCNIYKQDGSHTMSIGIGNSGFESLLDRLAAGSSITIKGTTIGGSSVQGLKKAGIRLRGHETVNNNIQVTIGGSAIDDGNIISHSGNAGIVLADIDQVSIENNTISDNGKGGILLVDVSTVSPHIKDNNIYHHTGEAGINIGGASNVTIGHDNDTYSSNDIYDNRAGIAFYVANNTDIDNMLDTLTRTASSGAVTIIGNNIHENDRGGIGVLDGITGTVTITKNDIDLNTRGGIRIQRNCTLNITENKIHDNIWGGIHTGEQDADGAGFLSALGSAVLTINKNKIYKNGEGGYGGGIDVRHASGTIYNNLVYRNHMGGIRFGWEDEDDPHITEIVNNTVANNGNDNGTPADPSDDRGGGIIYDDLAGAVNDNPTGIPPETLIIRNNICAYNAKAGIRACFANTEGSEERDYNLVYFNNGTTDDCGWYTLGGVSYVNFLTCANKQFGGCGAHVPVPLAMDGPHDIIADPLFVSIATDDYHLQGSSLAIDAGDDGTDMGAYGGLDPID